MIEYNAYVSQLHAVYDSGQFQDVTNCEFVELSSSQDELKAKFKFKAHEVNRYTNLLYNLEVSIQYESTFQEPQLAFRIWRIHSNSTLLEYNLTPLQSYLPPWFVTNIDLIQNEPWYIVGVCDTPDVVGGYTLDKEHYIKRWVAVYLLNWTELLPLVTHTTP